MAPKAFLLYATLLLLILAIFPHTILSRQSPEPKPFDFLQHLEGCHKGQTIKGVNQLKQYLRRFGYLTSANLDGNDEFDELLESAVKTYQLNYNLTSTGTLDSQTIKQMKMPRCGVPDIHENGRTSMTSGKSNMKHHHDQNLLHTVSHYSFFQDSPRWPSFKTQLTYAFTSSSTPAVDIQTLRSVCSSAFSKWAAVTGLSFVEVADQADIQIGINSGDHGDGFSFDGPGRALAHAFPPTDGRFDLDADENWSTNPRSEMLEFDLESVAVHEIGHLLGLDHSSVPTAVMASSIGAGAIKRELDGDDIAAVSSFSFMEVAEQADIRIGINSGDHGDGFSFDGPGGILAHAFRPEDGRFEYDADEKWSTNPMREMSEFDLESVAVHEIGHLLGLDHSSVPTAVMASGTGPGIIKRELDGDDIAGIRALYGLSK